MENIENMEQQPVTPGKKSARIINLVNGVVLLIMLAACLAKDGGFLSFIIGCFMGMGNFISMIVFITRKETMSFVSNIIWMLLMPVIGFGCCAATFEFHG